jgi:hypothetical protein
MLVKCRIRRQTIFGKSNYIPYFTFKQSQNNFLSHEKTSLQNVGVVY